VSDEESLVAVKAFISQYIDSVAQLEILLLLHGEPDKSWTASEVAQHLRVNLTSVMDELDRLCARGLLLQHPGRVPTWRFAGTGFIAEVQNLAQAYAERRVTVITLISSKPEDRIRVFTDAFKLRKDHSDG
jgi:hypothetical protein